ncbi:hypothetical protein PHISCL_09147 [Aspergillus sclerotialis]|uniref:Putative zinc-finger domain-containing protein n=1 Tax=Aspergillus sclerotialis TaxID=2070753 RepID=A0A3A2ZKV6_9EURO|nr:hypothetical protein PHISCL_09147 [Aspergillus sclerotialis]
MHSLNYNNVDNSRPNSRVPDFNTQPSSLPPPPFPFMGHLPPQHFPQFGYPPAQMSPLNYPPMPLPSGHAQVDGPAEDTRMNRTTFGSQATNTPYFQQDLDREEGEVTDREAGRSLSRNAMPAAYTGQKRLEMDVEKSQNASNFPEASTTGVPDLEEGEAVSSISSNSTRDSGSPYNPPISLSAEPYDPRFPADPELRDQSQPLADHLSNEEKSASIPKDIGTHGDSVKLLAQLRLQAQGALLGLAPHNIRYKELVEEGINATVLRRLYEDVGIKVATSQHETTPIVQNVASRSDRPSIPSQPVEPTRDHVQKNQREAEKSQMGKGGDSEKHAQVDGATASLPTSAQSEPGKPLERKELIARMLAAKAAKTSGAPLPSKPGPAKESVAQASGADDGKTTTAISSDETVSREKENRVKEKNKAQTELARQRIEQLKKQGLMRNQPKPPADTRPETTLHQEDNIKQTPAIPSATQHPLPDRPPQPNLGNTTRLPGLFMTASEQFPSSEPSTWPDRSHSADPTRQPRVTRKRPRASDFDEPTTMPQGQFTQGADGADSRDRLVIDISDDEFYGDDQNDIEMDTTNDRGPRAACTMPSSDLKASSAQNYPPQTELPSQKPFSSVNSVNSMSGTPQTWSSLDEEHLRQKDLAIREMRRKIAELEQRKKPKPTPSPQSSASSLDGHNDKTDTRLAGISPSAPVIAAGTHTPSNDNIASNGISNGLPTQMLASMNALQLEKLRSNYLRKQEIVAGLPSLDAEILRSQARLNEFKEQEQKLLSEIAKGNQGRQQLINELGALDLEINGLSLEDIEAAIRRCNTEAPRVPDNGEEDISASNAPVLQPQEQHAPCPAQDDVSPVQSLQPPIASHQSPPRRPEDVDGDVELGKEHSPSSVSESEGSAMDESSDSDSAEPASVDQEMSDVPGAPAAPAPSNLEDSEKLKAADQEDTSYMSSDHSHSLEHEHPHDAGIESDGGGPDKLVNQESLEEQTSRGSSVASEAYEPPEPENHVPAHPAHSFPSKSPGPVYSGDSGDPLDQAHSDKALTENVQDVDSHPREPLQIGLLDNEPRGDHAERKFTPYNSPLKYFKAYRYHPQYADEVSDGYRSLTYSHNIDPMRYLCPFEAAGGVCNDRSCEFQHFRDMSLSGASKP